MPPEPVLGPSVRIVTEGCPDDKVCFTVDGAAELDEYLDDSKFWREQVRLRCGQKDNQE